MALLLLTLPAAASDYTLEIFGNANEDEVLDMRDVTYIKLVIFGKKPATDFADANYDGKISMLDIGQTKLIILGKEKKLTIIDMNDRTVTVSKPIEGAIVTHRRIYQMSEVAVILILRR
jgi:iron complex transport system substrate-binding protein